MIMKIGCEDNCSNLRDASVSSSERSIDEVVKKSELLYASKKTSKWYRRGGNVFKTKKAIASPEKKKSKTIVACRQCGSPLRKTAIPAARRRRRRRRKVVIKSNMSPSCSSHFTSFIVHRSPSSALEAVQVVARLAAEVLRRLLLLMLMLLHIEALRLAHVHAADHAAHVGV